MGEHYLSGPAGETSRDKGARFRRLKGRATTTRKERERERGRDKQTTSARGSASGSERGGEGDERRAGARETGERADTMESNESRSRVEREEYRAPVNHKPRWPDRSRFLSGAARAPTRGGGSRNDLNEVVAVVLVT